MLMISLVFYMLKIEGSIFFNIILNDGRIYFSEAITVYNSEICNA